MGTFHRLYSHNQEDQTSCSLKDPSLSQISFLPFLLDTENIFKEKQQEGSSKAAEHLSHTLPTAFPAVYLPIRKANTVIQIKKQI